MRPMPQPAFSRASRPDANIPKNDDRDRTVDPHALRYTFGTHLSKAGVAPSAAQKLMRHSDIRLTMDTCTDLELADTARAIAALPGI